MIRKIFLGLVAIIVVLIALGFVLPADRHVERSITMDAPASEIHALVSDFAAWDSWSPWAKIDPDATYSLTGSGIGQTMTWESDHPKVGNGSQTITKIEPGHIQTKLSFDGQGTATADFTFEDAGNGQTNVTWSLDTNMREGVPLWMKPMGPYVGMMMDGMIGPEYEKGLANLKTIVEAN